MTITEGTRLEINQGEVEGMAIMLQKIRQKIEEIDTRLVAVENRWHKGKENGMYDDRVTRFGSVTTSHPIAQLKRLREENNFFTYVDEFVSLVSQVELTDEDQVALFVGGLSGDKKCIKVLNPRNLQQAISYAKLLTPDDQVVTGEGYPGENRGSSGENVELLSLTDAASENFRLQTSHPDVQVEVRGLMEVQVGVGSVVLDDTFFVRGYNIYGSVVAQGNPQLGDNVYLFSQNDVKVDCSNDPANIPGQGKAICHEVSDDDGMFTCSGIPCGTYELKPYYSGENTVFDITPHVLSISVKHQQVIVPYKFQVTGFSIGNVDKVKVKKRWSDNKYLKIMLAIETECDIAMLTVNDDEFWEGVSSVQVGDLPALQDAVTVVGYPIGGDTISVTSGVVSCMEMLSYAQGSTELLGVQIDAAINSGNSSGPAFNDKGKSVGIAFQSLKHEDAKNIGYLIPTPVILHFIHDFEKNGAYTGFSILGVEWQKMENPDLRSSMGMKSNQKGVQVRRVEPTAPESKVLLQYDVILSFDGVNIAKYYEENDKAERKCSTTQSSKVRVDAIICIQELCKIDPKSFTSQWTMLLPSTDVLELRRFDPTLMTCLLFDPYLKARIAAASIVVIMLSGASSTFLQMAEYSHPFKRGSFTSLSSSIGDVLLQLHKGIIPMIIRETHDGFMSSLFKILMLLLVSTLYAGLPDELLPTTIKSPEEN